MDAVLNWLWQGCAVALATFATLRLLNGARANVRYVVCWVALLLVAALPAVPALNSLAPQDDAVRFAPETAVVFVPYAWWTSGRMMIALWSVWAAIYTVKVGWAMAALRRARSRGLPFPADLDGQLPHWRQVRQQGRQSSLVLSEAVTTAAVLGGGAPVIAVAPSLLASLDAGDLDRVLVHEWAHVQRRDDIVNILQVLVRAVVGWHPAAWWLDRRLHVEREIACDEMTIDVTGSAKSYAACLINLAGLRRRERITLAPAVLTVSGLRRRVMRIVGGRSFISPRWSRGLAAASVSTLCLMSVTVAELTLVKATVLALPFDSIRSLGAVVAPVAMPAAASQAPPAIAVSQGARQSTPVRSRTADEPPAIVPVRADPDRAPAPAPRAAVDPAAQLDTIPAPDEVSSAIPESLPPVAGVPPQLAHATIEGSRSVWSAAADGGVALGAAAAGGGVAIGRKSKQAGVATAGFFNHVARRVAGAF